MAHWPGWIAALTVLQCPGWAQPTLDLDFEAGVPTTAQVTGEASVIADPVHGGQKALRVEPKGVVVIPVSPKPAYGTVTIWYYDAGTQLPDEKQYAFGPLVGLRDQDGGDVVYGRIYARYLAGNTGYGYINAVTGDWPSRLWAGGQVKAGWRKWTLKVLEDGGMEVQLDDRGVHYESAEMPSGFTSVVIYGSKEAFPDAAIVDDISVSVEGEMKPGVIERKALPGEFSIPFAPACAGKHPRLFFTEEELPALRERCRTTHKRFLDAAVQYGLASLTVPEGEPWLNDDTDAQRWGWWKMPTIALLAGLSDDPRYRETTRALLLAMCRSRHFQTQGEVDTGMGAANVLAGCAIGYDVVYQDLTEDERRFVQDKLWLQVHRLHDKGFLQNAPGAHYWQQDPQNNHLWHRMAGLLLACLALYGDVPEIDGYLDYAIRKAEEIVKWLPEDGSNHEAVGYQAFGTQYLVPWLWALRRCTTVDLLSGQPGIRALPHFRAHMVLPGGKAVWDYADGGRDVGWFSHYHFLCASLFDDSLAQGLHLANYDAAPASYDYQIWNCLFFDDRLQPAKVEDYPTWRYFPDVGIATFRSSWTDPDALAAFFKCGPYGGHRLNEYRDSFDPPHYVNVAHDHPDANSFMLCWRGQFFAMDAGYAHTRKLTEDHNTILVNGQGQAGEGQGWTQPIADMGSRARITEFFAAPGYGVVRGEAGASYEGLDRFTRTLLYVDNAYALIHDHLAAKEPSTIDWLYHCDGEWTPAGEQAWDITKGEAKLRLQIVYPTGLTCEVADHTADGGQGETKKRLRATLANFTEGDILALLMPLAGQPAEIEYAQATGDGEVFLALRRPDARTDRYFASSGPSAAPPNPDMTDARLAVMSHPEGPGGSIVLLGATEARHTEGPFLRLNAPANVLFRREPRMVAFDLSAPLGRDGGEVTVQIAESLLTDADRLLVNGVEQPRTAADGWVTLTCHLPTWRELLP